MDDVVVKLLRGARSLGDEQLARLVTGGSVLAYTIIYERYHRPLLVYCRSILRSEADAHDAVQSTFTRALEALQRNQRDAPLRPWMYRIAHNEAISLIRRRSAGEELSVALRCQLAGTEDRANLKERLETLVEDLRELPERPRHALLMRELGGLSHEEIAAALGTSVAGAKQAIFQARTALSAQAEGRAMPCKDVRRAISEGDGRTLRGRRIHAHLRDCPACVRFASGMARRRGRRHGLTAPLPAGPLTGMLSRTSDSGWTCGWTCGAAPARAGSCGSLGDNFSAAVIAKEVVVAGVLAGGAGLSQSSHQPAVLRPLQSTPPSSPVRMAPSAPLRTVALEARVDSGPKLRLDP